MFVSSFEQLIARIMNEVIKLMLSEIAFRVLRREFTMETLKMFQEDEDSQTLTYDTDLNDESLRILWTFHRLRNFESFSVSFSSRSEKVKK